ncbi:uncharacterized protein CTHT_0027710 [Thermochaetoides thermophila DSM 1495]|uniref:Uncharacterized protein n=1 Tax=Chaetomium thermophilum (strain DSM 1495 / CBS 144.50 / IMI 039719) TaxID=759272 RepID=G0S777_CHATD|nr:hypothetical protein CTHT_0027710 [Thermochaetoides thermophila DSM 1495]EGS20932.1 hypothetical protein CTHT_0027710 [Thermochaetoides thermophila DSM 1495]
MTSKGHHRRRSSIDRVIDLLADLEESQIALLLEDFNHTTPSNVPVAEAIALFEQHAAKQKRKSSIPPSQPPMIKLQTELERRHSKRISVPDPKLVQLSQTTAAVSPTSDNISHSFSLSAHPNPSLIPTNHSSADRHDRNNPPSLTLPPPQSPVHNQNADNSRPGTVSTSQPQTQSQKAQPPSPSHSLSRPRSYKRINRPALLSPTATAELHLLLQAFFNELPLSSSPSDTTATPSPTTPHSAHMLGGNGFAAPLSFYGEPEPELIAPGFDLLEPSPMRMPYNKVPPGGRGLRTMSSMSSIFEVLRSQ